MIILIISEYIIIFALIKNQIRMNIFLIVIISIFIIAFGLTIGDYLYYSHKLPKETIEEIESKISKLTELIEKEIDPRKNEQLIDIRDYWIEQKYKVIKYNKKNGK